MESSPTRYKLRTTHDDDGVRREEPMSILKRGVAKRGWSPSFKKGFGRGQCAMP